MQRKTKLGILVTAIISAVGVRVLQQGRQDNESFKAQLLWLPHEDDSQRALSALSMLDRAVRFTNRGRHALVINLMDAGLMPGIPRELAEPRRYSELIDALNKLAFPNDTSIN